MAGTGKRSLPPEQNARLALALAELYAEHKSDQAVADAIARVTGEKAFNQVGLSRIRRGVQGGSLHLATGVAALKGVSVVTLLGIGGEAAIPLGERDGFAAALEQARADYGTKPDAPPEWAWERARDVVLPSGGRVTALVVLQAAKLVELMGRDT